MSVRDTSIDPRLLESARSEFMEKGFLKAELKTICDNAGVTTGAVYKRYKGKEELFCTVVEEAVNKFKEFVGERTSIDFSTMTDEEVKSTWIMNEKYTLDVFKIIWDYRDEFALLLEKSAGTIYEDYRHDFSSQMTEAYMKYYSEARKRGLAKADISKQEMHVLCTSFWNSIYEPFIHGMSWKEIESHCKVLCRFFDWANAIGLK